MLQIQGFFSTLFLYRTQVNYYGPSHNLHFDATAFVSAVFKQIGTKNDSDLGFDQNVIDAIIAVTKINGENRFQAVQRTVKNPIACEVKLADLSDNMDLSRLPNISAKDLIRYKQYQKVQEILKEAYAIHQHVNSLDLDAEYPKFEYGSMRFNFQYLMNARFDQLHPLGGNQIDIAKF